MEPFSHFVVTLQDKTGKVVVESTVFSISHLKSEAFSDLVDTAASCDYVLIVAPIKFQA